MAAGDATIVDLDPPEESRDRSRTMPVAFAFCLAVSTAIFGQDRPLALRPAPSQHTFVYSNDGSTRRFIPPTLLDRPANRPPFRAVDVPVPVRWTQVLAVPPSTQGARWMVIRPDGGTVYVLESDSHGPQYLVGSSPEMRWVSPPDRAR